MSMVLVCKPWTPPAGGGFAELGSNSWLALSPTLLLPGTSQAGIGYDQASDLLFGYGGHTIGGGYPQIDWLAVYDILAGAQSTWIIPVLYSPAGSTVPQANCEVEAIHDPVNQLFVLCSLAGTGSGRFEWRRRVALIDNCRSPLLYDHATATWFASGLLGWVVPKFGSGFAFNYDDQFILSVDTKGDIANRRKEFNVWLNSVVLHDNTSWIDLGISETRGIGEWRSDMCLVWDDLRNRYWVVGGHGLSGGIDYEFQSVWYCSPTDWIWHMETGITPVDYFYEGWDSGEGSNQWTGYSASGTYVLAAVAQGNGGDANEVLGLHVNNPGGDAYLYKDYTSWNHVRTFIRNFTVHAEAMTNGQSTIICQHSNQTSGAISNLWLVKSGGSLYLDVQWEGGTPTAAFGPLAFGNDNYTSPYRICFETYVNASGYTKLFVDRQNYTTADVTRTGDKTAGGNCDRFKLGVFGGNSGNLDVYIDEVFHWNPDVSLCYLPWMGKSFAGVYDRIHDKILMFVNYNNTIQEGTVGDDALDTITRAFIYNPATKTWTVGAEYTSKGDRRTGDLKAYFAENYNVALVSESRGSTVTTNMGGGVFAYRYSDDLTGAPTPNSLTRTSTAPAYPRFGYVEMLSATSAKVHWNAVTGADGYNIYRAPLTFTTYPVGSPTDLSSEVYQYNRKVVATVDRPAWSSFTKINGAPVTDLFLTDNTINAVVDANGTALIYAYIVKAVKNSVESGCSPFWCTIPEFPTGVTVASVIVDSINYWRVSWTAPHSANGIAGYRVFYTISPGDITSVVEYTTTPITATTLDVPKSTFSGAGKFSIVAVDNLGQDGFPSNGAWTKHPDFDSYYHSYFE